MVIGVHRLRALPCVQIGGGELSPRLGLARPILRLMVTATWLEIKCSSEVGDGVANGRERMASVNGVVERQHDADRAGRSDPSCRGTHRSDRVCSVIIVFRRFPDVHPTSPRRIRSTRRGVAQPGRAPGSGPGGRRFKSSLPDQSPQTLLAAKEVPRIGAVMSASLMPAIVSG